MQIPSDLKQIPNWILWCSQIREGRATKVPCDPAGRPASVTEVSSWMSYQDALDAVELGNVNGPMIAGIGFCFTPDDPFMGIDLDGCYPAMSPAVKEIVAKFPTYTEVSPSGTGLKIFTRADMGHYTRNRTSDVPGFKQLEVYDQGRFFTVTGDQFGFVDEVTDCQDSVYWLLEKYLPPVTRRKDKRDERSTEPAGGLDAPDEEIRDLMFSFSNGGAARKLWDGDMSAYDDNQSSADLALLSYIAFVTGPDEERIARIFSSSALGQRAKWEREDYRDRTIQKALDDMDEFYTPPLLPKLTPADFGIKPVGEEATREPGIVAPQADEPVGPPASSPAGFPIPESGLIRDIVDLLGPGSESPDSTLALSTLVMLSAAVGWQRRITWIGSEEPCIIFAVICGPSAKGKKTTGMRSIEALFRKAEIPVKIESTGHVSGRALVETAMGGADIFYVKEPVVDSGDPDERMQQQADLDRWENNRQEKLNNPPKVVLVWDEFASMLDVSAHWQRDTRTQLLMMYNGKHSGIRTSGKGGITVPGGKTSMSLIGTMTDDDLRRCLDASQSADGLMGRILFSPPGSAKPALPRPPESDPAYEAREAAVVEKLRAFYAFANFEVASCYDGWTGGATRRWDEWYFEKYTNTTEIENLLFSRGQATAVKIACLLAMAEDTEFGQVQESHINQAIEILESSMISSMDAVTAHAESQRDRYTDALFSRIERDGPAPLSRIVRDWGMLNAKEAGDRMPERQVRIQWIEGDPRLTIVKGESGKGHRVELAT
jgi:hypothetical protein